MIVASYKNNADGCIHVNWLRLKAPVFVRNVFAHVVIHILGSFVKCRFGCSHGNGIGTRNHQRKSDGHFIYPPSLELFPCGVDSIGNIASRFMNVVMFTYFDKLFHDSNSCVNDSRLTNSRHIEPHLTLFFRMVHGNHPQYFSFSIA